MLRIVGFDLLGKRNGAFGEALEAKIVNIAFLGEFNRGLDAVARIPGSGSKTNGLHGLGPRSETPRCPLKCPLGLSRQPRPGKGSFWAARSAELTAVATSSG